jgi:hypothetical protein
MIFTPFVTDFHPRRALVSGPGFSRIPVAPGSRMYPGPGCAKVPSDPDVPSVNSLYPWPGLGSDSGRFGSQA